MRVAWVVAVLCALWVLVGCSQETDEFVMPDLSGKYWIDAEPQLRGLGWRGMLVLGADVTGGESDRNRIVYQDPAAGSETKKDAEITLRFGA